MPASNRRLDVRWRTFDTHKKGKQIYCNFSPFSSGNVPLGSTPFIWMRVESGHFITENGFWFGAILLLHTARVNSCRNPHSNFPLFHMFPFRTFSRLHEVHADGWWRDIWLLAAAGSGAASSWRTRRHFGLDLFGHCIIFILSHSVALPIAACRVNKKSKKGATQARTILF